MTWLEAAGGHDNDTGSEDGVDEFIYHFEEPTEIRLSLDRFDEAPQLIALDAVGERDRPRDGERRRDDHAERETTLRVVHPHAGDATAAPFAVFLEPILPEAVAEPAAVGVPAQANPNDVATLKASKNCPFCNLAGLSWNACPGRREPGGVSISATPTSPWRTWRV